MQFCLLCFDAFQLDATKAGVNVAVCWASFRVVEEGHDSWCSLWTWICAFSCQLCFAWKIHTKSQMHQKIRHLQTYFFPDKFPSHKICMWTLTGNLCSIKLPDIFTDNCERRAASTWGLWRVQHGLLRISVSLKPIRRFMLNFPLYIMTIIIIIYKSLKLSCLNRISDYPWQSGNRRSQVRQYAIFDEFLFLILLHKHWEFKYKEVITSL